MPIRDLEELLSSLHVAVADGEWCVVSLDAPPLGVKVRATVAEAEGTSYVITTGDALALGIEPSFVGSWLTLEVNSALDAVGLTAAVATALATAGIACNVFAGLHHDHLLVPIVATELAVATLMSLQDARIGTGGRNDSPTPLTTLT